MALRIERWLGRDRGGAAEAGADAFGGIGTAIGGLLPLAVQNSGLYSPMAWVIIGGLISSTLLARLVTPVMYKLIPPSGHEPRNIERGTQSDASGVFR